MARLQGWNIGQMVCLGLTASLAAHPAFAQELATTGAAQDAQQETGTATSETTSDIVVTARRRAERVQDVPIAAQALSGDTLQSYNLRTAADLSRIAPSLLFSGSFETVPKITIRGVGTNEFTANVNPAVGLYIDDVYQGLGAGQNFQLFDIARVEVLRGPQGTLFGKNSTGGAVQYFTNDPTDEVGGRVEIGVGRFGLFETEAALNVPLAEGVSLRVSGNTTDRNGYWRNLFLDTRDGRINRWAGRAKLKLNPTDDIEVVLKFAKGEADDDLRRSRQVGRLPSGSDLSGYVSGRRFFEGESDKFTFDRVDTTNMSARISVDFGSATLTSVTGYDKAVRDSFEDTDQNPFELLNIFYPSDGRAFSQEVRLAGEAGNVKYVVGGFYGRERQQNGISLTFFDCFVDATCSVPRNAADLRVIASVFGVPTDGLTDAQVVAILPNALNGALAASRSTYDLSYRLRSRTLAGFAEATWAVTDRLNVTGGLRYTHEKRSFFGQSLAGGGAALGPGYGFGGLPPADDSKAWDDVSGRLIVDFKPADDVMLYASASRAFRAGNYNGGAFSQIELALPPVDPENVWSYEAGLKSQFFDRSLTFNASTFYIDFRNKQEFVAENAQILLRNAASARTYGFEADVNWTLNENLNVTGGVALLNAKYKRFVTDLGDFSGNRLPNAPELSANGSVTYRTPLTEDVSGYVAVDVQHRTRTFYQANNDPVTSDDGFTSFDLRFGVNAVEDRLVVSAFVNNLFNVKYIVDSNDIGAPFFVTVLTENLPRTWGINAAYSF